MRETGREAVSNPERMPHLGHHATDRVSVFALRVLVINYVKDCKSDGSDEQSLHSRSSEGNHPPLSRVLDDHRTFANRPPYSYGGHQRSGPRVSRRGDSLIAGLDEDRALVRELGQLGAAIRVTQRKRCLPHHRHS
jgi:hypothetical protein